MMQEPLPARVLMTADTVGGVWQYTLLLAAALARRGVAVLVAASGPEPSPAQRQAAADIPGLVLHHRPYRLEWMPQCEGDLSRTDEWLMSLDQFFQPEVVHINGYAAAALPWRAPVIVVCHSCVRTWWQAVHGCDAPAEWQPYIRRVGEGLAAAEAVVAPSHAFLATIAAIYGSLPASAVVYNGRDPGEFASSHKKPVVFAAGRLWDSAKNMTLLDAVAPSLPWPVYMAGPVRDPAHGRQAAPVNATPLGELAPRQMARWLASAAIFAAPARYEPFGLCVLEAALSGCALVLGDIPTLRELWSDAALFVDPNNAGDLEAAIRRLINNPELRSVLAAAAEERAQRYTAERMADGYLQVYAIARQTRQSSPVQSSLADPGGGRALEAAP